MTVYVVTAGDYDDYHIEAMFSTHEKAVEYMGGHPEKFNDIETFEVDPAPAKKFATAYWHSLTGAGEDRYVQENIEEELEEIAKSSERGISWFRELAWTENFSTAVCFTGKSYISAEHAKKLAVEERQKYLREHA